MVSQLDVVVQTVLVVVVVFFGGLCIRGWSLEIDQSDGQLLSIWREARG